MRLFLLFLFVVVCSCASVIALDEVRYEPTGAPPPTTTNPNNEGGTTTNEGGSSSSSSKCEGQVCEDFEVEPTRWTRHAVSANIDLIPDTSRGAGSRQVARASIPSASDSSASFEHVLSSPRGQGSTISIRGHFRLGGSFVDNGSLIELRHPYREAKLGGVSLKTSGPLITFDLTDSAGASRANDPGIDDGLDRNTWVCLVLTVQVGKTGHVKIVREKKIAIEKDADTLIDATEWKSVSIGLPFAKNSMGSEVAFDDLVISDRELTCP